MDDLEQVAIVLALMIFGVLFGGSPDIADAIIYWLSDGTLKPK